MILATPSFRQYKSEHPDERITWICFDMYRDVIKNLKGLDSYIAWPLNPAIPRIGQELSIWTYIKEYAKDSFDKVISSQLYPDHNWPTNPGVHLIDQMASLAGVVLKDRSLKLGNFCFDRLNQQVVTCNSKSNTQIPVWQKEQWGRLKEDLAYSNIRLIDGDECDYTLPEWQQKIYNSGAYVGLDSGGTWLAATTRTPQICLYLESPTCPYWLTGLRAAKVKDLGLTWEMVNPDPNEVALLIKQIIFQGRTNAI